jgi:dihydroorotase
MKLLLKNCDIYNADSNIKGNILIEDELIVEITQEEPQADKVIDCAGKKVVPGLIDMHVHFRDPGLEYKEDVISGSEAAAAGGVTACVCMANTKPVNDNRFITEQMINKCDERGLIDLFPVGSVTKKMQGEELVEMGDMLEAGAIAFSDDGLPVMNSEVMRRACEYAAQFGTLILSHSEDKDLTGGGVINDGETATLTGLKGIPAEAEEIQVARDILISKLTGGRIHIQHISTKGSLELIKWAKQQDLNVTCEVAPHHFSLTDKELMSYDTSFKMAPPLRGEEDMQAMKEGLKEGWIDAIATDHAPHHKDEKFVEFDLAPNGITGLQTFVPLTLKLVEEGVLTMLDFVALTSKNPADILGLEDRGEIAAGKIADITVLDTEKEYVFDLELNKSKGINSPYLNKTLKGISACTIKYGEVVAEYGKLKA